MSLINANALRIPLADNTVQCAVTSPPYWGLRDYGISGQLGSEPTMAEYIANMVAVFREVKRILRDDGTLWLNLGDSYATPKVGNTLPAGFEGKRVRQPNRVNTDSFRKDTPAGLKPKDLCGIPWRVAFALQDDGWYLRSDIIWCLSGGTILYARTQKGDTPMMIKDLTRLDPATVKLWNGKAWTQVLGWSKNHRNDDELEIVLRSGERISCTPTHNFPTQRGLVEAGNLKIGDCMQRVKLPEPDFPKDCAIDEDAAWLAGLYIAEGSHSDDCIQIAGHAKEEARWNRIQKIAARFGGGTTRTIDGNIMNIRISGKVLNAIIDLLVTGKKAIDKGFSPVVWQYSDKFIASMLDGYLRGDGHWDESNNRWRLGFSRNYNLERDLRTACARLGLKIILKLSTVKYNGKDVPTFRGEIRYTQSKHHNVKNENEIIEIRKARCRYVYDIGVADEPHTFALASGILTHNSKPNPMPESVTDRPTKAHEYIFLMTKRAKYYYDAEAIREPQIGEPHSPGNKTDNGRLTSSMGHYEEPDRIWASNGKRNARTVWEIATQPMSKFAQISRARRVGLDAVSDGMKRIVLPGCPIHVGQFAQVATDFCGGHEVDLLNHIVRIYNRLAQEPPSDYAPILQPLFSEIEACNSDYSHPGYSPSAIDHNNETHRMALALDSSPAYIPFFEIADRIDDRSRLLASFVKHLCIYGSNILPGEMDARLLDRTPGRIVDKFSLPIPPECKCLYYEYYTMKTDHFATYPEKLVTRCILAGTSEKGCCPTCGKPWERVVEKTGEFQRRWSTNNAEGSPYNKQSSMQNTYESKGWSQSCTCSPANPVPSLVFDPFSGSGTTGVVALRYGRRYVGIELSMPYIRLAVDRIGIPQGVML